MKSLVLFLALACSLDAGTFFIRKTGSDSNAGTSAGAAWVTIQKAFSATCGGGASACTTGGDTIYVGAGIYREVVTVANTYASVVSLIGDWDGVQTGDPGVPVMSAQLVNDYTISNNGPFVFNGKSNITIQGFEVDNSNSVSASFTAASGSTGLTIKWCVFRGLISFNSAFSGTVAADTSANWVFDSNLFLSQAANVLVLILTRSATADYDANITVKNNIFAAGLNSGVRIQPTGASTFFGGGVRVYNNTMLIGGPLVSTSAAQISSTFPVVAYGNQGNTVNAFSANVAGQIIEDYNVLGTKSGVTQGGNSVITQSYVGMWASGDGLFNGKNSVSQFAMATAAWKNMGTITGDTRPPGTTVDDTTVGTIVWTNPNNSKQSDTVNATNVVTASATSHYLKATNFGFAVPGGVTIIGIMVDVQRDKSAGTGVLKDNSVKLVNSSGTIAGNENADTATTWPGALTWATYGNIAGGDLWGLTLAPADVNNSNFGVVVSVKETGGAASGTASIDCIRMTVFYTPQITVDMLGTTRPYGTVLFGAEGTATSGGNKTLTQSTKNFPVNGFNGYTLNLTGGTGSGQVKQIASNTATVITVDGNWTTNPDSTTTYKVYQGPSATGGKCTAGATTTCTDTNAAWGTSQWTGFVFKVTSGTGSGQTTGIASNTATVITFQKALGTGLDSTSVYQIFKAPGTSMTSINYSPGSLEVPQTCFVDTGTVHTTGNSARILGPGYCDFQIAVGARSTTVTVFALFDAAYAGTKPQMSVLNGTECGVTNASVTSTASSATWQQLSLTFTPTVRGIVTIRLISSSTAPTGSAFFGDFGKIDQDSTKFQFTRRNEFFLDPHSITPVIRRAN